MGDKALNKSEVSVACSQLVPPSRVNTKRCQLNYSANEFISSETSTEVSSPDQSVVDSVEEESDSLQESDNCTPKSQTASAMQGSRQTDHDASHQTSHYPPFPMNWGWESPQVWAHLHEKVKREMPALIMIHFHSYRVSCLLGGPRNMYTIQVHMASEVISRRGGEVITREMIMSTTLTERGMAGALLSLPKA